MTNALCFVSVQIGGYQGSHFLCSFVAQVPVGKRPLDRRVPTGAPVPLRQNWSLHSQGNMVELARILHYLATRCNNLVKIWEHPARQWNILAKIWEHLATQPGFPDQADHNLTILWHHRNHTNFLTMILP